MKVVFTKYPKYPSLACYLYDYDHFSQRKPNQTELQKRKEITFIKSYIILVPDVSSY